VDFKKVPLSVMLDPRYIQYIMQTASDEGIGHQDYIRRALEAFLPNPYKPKRIPYEIPKVKPPKG